MSTVKINGTPYEYDFSTRNLGDAIALEAGIGMRFGDFEEELAKGSAKAFAALIWDVWRRNGVTVDFKHMLDGTIDVDLLEFAESVQAAQASKPEDPRTDPK